MRSSHMRCNGFYVMSNYFVNKDSIMNQTIDLESKKVKKQQPTD